MIFYHTEWVADPKAFDLDDGEHLLSLLHELTGMGAVMRRIISAAIIDKDIYSVEFLQPIAGKSIGSELLSHAIPPADINIAQLVLQTDQGRVYHLYRLCLTTITLRLGI